MTSFADALALAREHGDFAALDASFPYGRFLGLSLTMVEGRVRGRLEPKPENEGNPRVHALHGGTLGALLEYTAIGHVLYESQAPAVPKTINFTVEYLRSASMLETFCVCTTERLGKRIAVVRASAYQESPDRPVAAATAHFLLPSTERTEP